MNNNYALLLWAGIILSPIVLVAITLVAMLRAYDKEYERNKEQDD